MQHVAEPPAAPGGADHRVRAAQAEIQQAVQRMRTAALAPAASPASPRAASPRRLQLLPRGVPPPPGAPGASGAAPATPIDPASRPTSLRAPPTATEPGARRRFRVLPRVRAHPRLFRFF